MEMEMTTIKSGYSFLLSKTKKSIFFKNYSVNEGIIFHRFLTYSAVNQQNKIPQPPRKTKTGLYKEKIPPDSHNSSRTLANSVKTNHLNVIRKYVLIRKKSEKRNP
jgi:hypothetical protein